MPRFTTERLLIRPLAEQDKAMYLSLYTDAKGMRNMSEPLTYVAAENAFSKTLIAMEKEKPQVMTWAIVNQENNLCIGLQALSWHTPEIANIADIGIMLSRASNGKLLPEEAMGALMEYAFNYLSVDKINAFYARKNLATQRFVKKLGFVLDAAQQPGNTNNSYQYFDKEKWLQTLICQVL